MGSLEITELIRRRLAHDGNYLAGDGLWRFQSRHFLQCHQSVRRPARKRPKDFWFNVNAELIIYGATEPDAKVTLGGHEIKLRSDGTFSFRFALPDGKYDLPAVAVSADGTDGARGGIEIQPRDANISAMSARHPQDPSLKPPLPDNL